MDSGNSGSLQSSSGGDEEYDSRTAHSFLMNTHSPPHLSPMSTATPPPLFNTLSNYIKLQSTTWPRPAFIRSDPNPPPSHHPISFQAPATAAGESNNHLGAARNPRKRSRASRRAPTTVLTTDTTNFRAMVQEFTGIPAPPFNTSSLSRTRLDLFWPRSNGSEAPYLRCSTASSVPTIPINYQLPITQNNFQNPNSLTSLPQSNPRFLFPSSDPIASKPHDQDSFGIPTTSEFDDVGSSLHENHASTTLH